jgi:predicted nucleic acid-binding protein
VRVFLDTNVWISAFVAPGACRRLVAFALPFHETLSSALVRQEITSVLTEKLNAPPPSTQWLEEFLRETRPLSDANPEIGDNDARLLAGASAAGAELFVTGNNALLEKGFVGAMRIVSPREAWLMLFSPPQTG